MERKSQYICAYLIKKPRLILSGTTGQQIRRWEPFAPVMCVFYLPTTICNAMLMILWMLCSGAASVDEDDDLILLDNSSGFSLHEMSTATVIATYPVAEKRTHKPMPIMFCDRKSLIIAGSDEGTVLIFDRNGGSSIDALHHAPHGLVQSIAVRYISPRENRHIIELATDFRRWGHIKSCMCNIIR